MHPNSASSIITRSSSKNHVKIIDSNQLSTTSPSINDPGKSLSSKPSTTEDIVEIFHPQEEDSSLTGEIKEILDTSGTSLPDEGTHMEVSDTSVPYPLKTEEILEYSVTSSNTSTT